MSESMYDIAIDRLWTADPWQINTLGGASVNSVSGDILTVTAAASGHAYRHLWLPVIPGMRIESEVWGRYLSGAPIGTGMFVDLLDHDATNVLANRQRLDFAGDDWKRYHLSYTVPLDQSPTARFARIHYGVKDTLGGDARLQLPQLRISRAYGVPIVIAKGFFRLTNGALQSLSFETPSLGVASMAFNGSTTVTVTLTHSWPAGPGPVIRPNILLTPSGNHFYIPIASAWTGGATPSFDVRWSNGTSIPNVSAIASNLEVHFLVYW